MAMNKDDSDMALDAAGTAILSKLGSEWIDPSAALYLLSFALEAAVYLGLKQRAYHTRSAPPLLLRDPGCRQSLVASEVNCRQLTFIT